MERIATTGTDVEGWYRAHHAHLVRLGALACGSQSAAEDIVQDLFVRLYRQPPDLDDPDRPLPYLRTAVLHRSRTAGRSRQRGDRAARRLGARAETTTHDDGRIDDLARRRILRAVQALPDRQREVTLLRHWVGLSESEIAETLGISPGTVKSAAHAARSRLTPILEVER